MNTKYSNTNSFFKGSSVLFAEWYPERAQRELVAQSRLRYRSEHDPEQPPRPERGDIYIMIGTIVGLIVFGAAGAIIGYHYLGIIGAIYCFFGGVIVGGIIGATVGSLIKKRIEQRRGKTKTNAEEPLIEKL